MTMIFDLPDIFSSAYQVEANFEFTRQTAGWASGESIGNPFSVNHVNGPLMGQTESLRGLPVIGFAVRQRSFGSAAVPRAFLAIDHAA